MGESAAARVPGTLPSGVFRTDGNAHTQNVHEDLDGRGAVRRINVQPLHSQRKECTQQDTNEHNAQERCRDGQCFGPGDGKHQSSYAACQAQNAAEGQSHLEFFQQKGVHVVIVDLPSCETADNWCNKSEVLDAYYRDPFESANRAHAAYLSHWPDCLHSHPLPPTW